MQTTGKKLFLGDIRMPPNIRQSNALVLSSSDPLHLLSLLSGLLVDISAILDEDELLFLGIVTATARVALVSGSFTCTTGWPNSSMEMLADGLVHHINQHLADGRQKLVKSIEAGIPTWHVESLPDQAPCEETA